MLQIGSQTIGTVPRLHLSDLIGVYLPAAVFLDTISRRARPWVQTRRRPLSGRSTWRAPPRGRRGSSWPSWLVLVNVDIFGYPTLYTGYFVSTPPVFLPR